MDSIFSDRITDVPRSFIREILKVTIDSEVISFAGGLPNRELFPVEELRKATNKVFDAHGRDVCQYGTSEGSPELRERGTLPSVIMPMRAESWLTHRQRRAGSGTRHALLRSAST